MSDVKKFVIERERWARGSTSQLLMPDETMCCLGFFGLACGYSQAEIRGVATPGGTVREDGWPAWLLDENDNTDGDLLIDENDASDVPDDIREKRIADLFAKHGVEVEFK